MAMIRRILTIDGGGIRGAFPAALLAELEDSLGEPVSEYFDLIAGTSTGGIIALGLGMGLTAGEILSFYTEHGPRVFAGAARWRRLRQLLKSKYSSAALKEALSEMFGDRRLGESSTRLVIPSASLENGEVYIYKTAHHPRLERDYRERAVDIALATSAAPTYFPAHRSPAGVPLIDGGIWAANPAGLAAVEAVGLLCWPPDSTRILSLGCTASPLDLAARRVTSAGVRHWAFQIASAFMAAQASASLGTAHTLLGHDSVVRVNPSVPAGRYGLDTPEETASLAALGTAEARKLLPKARDLFFRERAETFAPHHTLQTDPVDDNPESTRA